MTMGNKVVVDISTGQVSQVEPTQQDIDDFNAKATAWSPVNHAMVIRERARRLSLGFDYNFGDSRGVHRIGTTDADMVGWSEVTDLADALTAKNDTTTTIAIVTDTGPCNVTAPEWADIRVAAGAFRQPIWAASFTILGMNPVPADYAADSRWS